MKKLIFILLFSISNSLLSMEPCAELKRSADSLSQDGPGDSKSSVEKQTEKYSHTQNFLLNTLAKKGITCEGVQENILSFLGSQCKVIKTKSQIMGICKVGNTFVSLDENGVFEMWDPNNLHRAVIGKFVIPAGEKIQPNIQLVGNIFADDDEGEIVEVEIKYILFNTNFNQYCFNLISKEICDYSLNQKCYFYHLKNGFTIKVFQREDNLYILDIFHNNGLLHSIESGDYMAYLYDFSDKGYCLFLNRDENKEEYCVKLNLTTFETTSDFVVNDEELYQNKIEDGVMCQLPHVIMHNYGGAQIHELINNKQSAFDCQLLKTIWFDSFPAEAMLIGNKIIKPGKKTICCWSLDKIYSYEVGVENDQEIQAPKKKNQKQLELLK